VASTFRDADDEFDIRVQFDASDRSFREQINEIKLADRQNRLIPLPALARIEYRQGPTVISRKNRQRMVTVSANVLREVSSVGEVYQDLERRVRDKAVFPAGYGYAFGGEVERMQENFREIFVALGLATVLTFLLLAGILESYRFPVMIMLSLPLSMITVFLILFITGTTSNIFSLMAVVTLVGMVINSAIVVVDYANQLVREGKSVEDALVTSCVIRLRPLLMVNLTTVIAWIPLALGMGMGGGFRAPMAVVSIGGMIGGGFLTLFVVPPLYMIFSRKQPAR
jgi:HAE1 family hydrophobic/amphiphilic exporter-1